jgi:two-component system chemotaxis sensor kinase CheA
MPGSPVSKLKTVQKKLTRIMLVISGLIGIATFSVVVSLNMQVSSRHLAEVQGYIEEGIASKGKVLTENHSLALRGMTLDNAFVDMQRLVEHTVQNDADLVYGIYIGSERVALAYSRRDEASHADDPAKLQQAWLALGLAPAELFATQATTRRVNRLGLDLLEVAVPVVDDEGTALGTIRYGFSTRRMQEALTKANSDASESQARSIKWLGSLLTLITGIGLVLSRMQAFRITRPIGALTKAAQDLASGNRSVRVDIHSGDELELLGSSFNHMVEELNTSYGKLEEMNRTLEQKVEERTEELALRNRDMRLVLDNVDQGFVTLSPEGRMTGGRSRVINEWFGDCPDGSDFAEHMARHSGEFRDCFGLGWMQLKEQFLPLDLCLDQLPKQLRVAERTWSFRYLPFFQEKQLDGVLVVANEITARLAHEREEAEQREIMQAFTRLMLDRSGFLNFASDASAAVSSVCTRELDSDLPRLKRVLHTLKGNSAMMGLSLVSAQCHQLEEELQAEPQMSDASLAELTRRWQRITQHIAKLAPAGDRPIEVPVAEYSALLGRIAKEPIAPELLEQLKSWRLEPALYPLERLAEQARSLAQRLGKGDLDISVRAERVRLDPLKWRSLFMELVHVVRNAVDHGIESPEERRAAGKPAAGRLLLGAQISAGVLSFEVSDDGGGIDWETLRAKGMAKGLPCSTELELLDILCIEGISSRSQSSEVSGRGIGMAAVKQVVEQLKGRIDVRSSAQGTTWLFHFPSRPRMSQFPDAGLSSKSQVARLIPS